MDNGGNSYHFVPDEKKVKRETGKIQIGLKKPVSTKINYFLQT